MFLCARVCVVGIDLQEWLDNLSSCGGLAAAIAENVNEAGEIPTFRSFEQQKAKREGEVAALEAKESRTEEEEAELAAHHLLELIEGGPARAVAVRGPALTALSEEAPPSKIRHILLGLRQAIARWSVLRRHRR